jgi:hypothetical protein
MINIASMLKQSVYKVGRFKTLYFPEDINYWLDIHFKLWKELDKRVLPKSPEEWTPEDFEDWAKLPKRKLNANTDKWTAEEHLAWAHLPKKRLPELENMWDSKDWADFQKIPPWYVYQDPLSYNKEFLGRSGKKNPNYMKKRPVIWAPFSCTGRDGDWDAIGIPLEYVGDWQIEVPIEIDDDEFLNLLCLNK